MIRIAKKADLAAVVGGYRSLLLFEREHPDCVANYNRFGGALAYGHPYGASGAILLAHLIASLKAAGGGRGLLSIAGAGGMGEAIALELVE